MVNESGKARFGSALLVRGFADNAFAELKGDFRNLRVKLGQIIGARFLNPVGRIVDDPARIHERLFARLGDNPSPALACFLPYARRFKLRFGDIGPMFGKQSACFASSLLGVLQAPFYCIPSLGRNLQNARHDLAEKGEDNEEKREAENHLREARP